MEYDGLITKPTLEELYHHGIKGQKWGVKNGPPYPLSSKISTGKALKKSGNTPKKKSTNTSKSNTKYGSPLLASIVMTVGVATIATIADMVVNKAANKAVQKVQQAAKKKTFRELSETRENERIDKKTGLRKKADPDATPEEDLRMTNALRGDKNKTAKNTFNNCTYCTTAYDLRRRGFDVVAGSTKHGTTTQDIATWYKNGRFLRATLPNKAIRNRLIFNTAKNRQYVKDQIVKHSGEGSRGNLCVMWAQGYGSGHSMVYEVTNGKLVIRDGQSNKTYTDDHKIGPRSVDHILAQVMLNKVDFMRTDNLTPNYELLKKRGIIA